MSGSSRCSSPCCCSSHTFRSPASGWCSSFTGRISMGIVVERDASIATVILNRPEKLNALTKAMCDLRICGESSRFGAPIKNLGLVMAYPEMAPLVRLAGADVALEILLEGRIFDAAEAKDKRLVTRIVPDADVAAEARATAQRIADGDSLRGRPRFGG